MLSVLFLNGANVYAADEFKCTELADKFLTNMNFETFQKPSSHVKKSSKDGSYIFDRSGSKVLISKNSFVSTSNVSSFTLITLDFDSDCKKVTKIVGSGNEMAFLADAEVCEKYYAREGGTGVTLEERTALIWCKRYFPKQVAEVATKPGDKKVDPPPPPAAPTR